MQNCEVWENAGSERCVDVDAMYAVEAQAKTCHIRRRRRLLKPFYMSLPADRHLKVTGSSLICITFAVD